MLFSTLWNGVFILCIHFVCMFLLLFSFNTKLANMSNTALKPVPFAIRVYPANKEWFQEYANTIGNQPEAFKALCEANNTDANNSTEALQTEIESLKNSLEVANKNCNELQTIINDFENAAVDFRNTTDENTFTCVQTAIAEAKKRELVTSPSFVFTPNSELKRSIERCIAYQIKNRKLDKSTPNLPSVFTESALQYYINNEFTFIKK